MLSLFHCYVIMTTITKASESSIFCISHIITISIINNLDRETFFCIFFNSLKPKFQEHPSSFFALTFNGLRQSPPTLFRDFYLDLIFKNITSYKFVTNGCLTQNVSSWSIEYRSASDSLIIWWSMMTFVGFRKD